MCFLCETECPTCVYDYGWVVFEDSVRRVLTVCPQCLDQHQVGPSDTIYEHSRTMANGTWSALNFTVSQYGAYSLVSDVIGQVSKDGDSINIVWDVKI